MQECSPDSGTTEFLRKLQKDRRRENNAEKAVRTEKEDCAHE